MALSEKFARKQLELFHPLFIDSKLETARRGQEKLGKFINMTCKKEVKTEKRTLQGGIEASVSIPNHEPRDGIMLYLHGGGYCCGEAVYANGVASLFAEECGIRVFTFAYRLAPEHRFPGPVEDALIAYKHLLTCGYAPNQIVLCGESSGGGLVFALMQKLKEEHLPLPAGAIACSPWTDLTSSGASYTDNKDVDISMTKERLQFYADQYTDDKKHPLASPIFGDMTGMPPSLIFVGGNEIMLSDSATIHEKLIKAGCDSELVIAPELWHVYILYRLKERTDDFKKMNSFLKKVLPPERKLRWMRLDNAAKIYPAARRRTWTNAFRLSATLKEPVDVPVLQSALDVTARRFPSMSVRLCTGVFWYYLEELSKAPDIRMDKSYPLEKMKTSDIKTCAFRVLVYENRIAVELFHSITDGNGGLVFLKTLVAEYLHQKYGVDIPAGKGVLDRLAEPTDTEMEDSFLKYSGNVTVSRKESKAYALHGTREPDGFLHDVTFFADVNEVHQMAKSHGVSVTAFLTAVMMQATIDIQKKKLKKNQRMKPVKVLLPVNLRKLFDSETLRNFALYIIPEINPAMGEYTMDELCKNVYYQMRSELTPQKMSAKIATNVNSEKSVAVKVMPLFIKNFVMKMVFNAVGERTSCFTFSNLGAVDIPEEMKPYIDRFDFVLSPQASAPNNCSAISYGDTLVIHFIRNTAEPELEAAFQKVMRGLGIRMRVESNDWSRKPTAKKEEF